MTEKADKKVWVLALSVILNVILAGAFGYGMGTISSETPKDVTNVFYDNRTFNYNDQQYNQSYDNYHYSWMNYTAINNGTQPYSGVPAYDLTMLAGDCYDFPFWNTDADCAIGDLEIHIGNPQKYVVVELETFNSLNSTLPDSFAIDFVFHRNDPGWTEGGMLVPTVVSVDMNATVESLVVYNLTTMEPVNVIKRTQDDMRAIAWTDFFGGTFIDNPDGALGYLRPGETGTATFTMYFNEMELPDLEDGQGMFAEVFYLWFIFESGQYQFEIVDLTIYIMFQP